MDQFSAWCAKYWTYILAGGGYILVFAVFAKAAFARPIRRFLGEHEPE